MDFDHGDDTFELENQVFTKLGSGSHPLNSAFFHLGAPAADGNDYVVYNRANGHLPYDMDGKGGGMATLIAGLKNHAALAANDFQVI